MSDRETEQRQAFSELNRAIYPQRKIRSQTGGDCKLTEERTQNAKGQTEEI